MCERREVLSERWDFEDELEKNWMNNEEMAIIRWVKNGSKRVLRMELNKKVTRA